MTLYVHIEATTTTTIYCYTQIRTRPKRILRLCCMCSWDCDFLAKHRIDTFKWVFYVILILYRVYNNITINTTRCSKQRKKKMAILIRIISFE